MKRNFLMTAAIAAMVLASCSKEDTATVEPGGKEISGKTYATFTFREAGTRATETDLNSVPSNEVKLGEIQFLIFDAQSGVCEVNTNIDGNTNKKTVLVKAGPKKIYTLANLTPGMKALVDETVFGPDKSGTHAEFLKVAYDAGTPGHIALAAWAGSAEFPAYPAQTEVTGSYSLSPLHTYTAGISGFPMSSSSEKTYTLKGDISAADSEAATGGSVEERAAKNNFTISVDFMLAKVGLIVPLGVTVNNGTISGGTKFTVRNLAKYTYLTKNAGASYYHNVRFQSNFNGADDPSASIFYTNNHFDYASNIEADAVADVPNLTAGKYVYVAENTNTSLSMGQASYIIMKTKYLPSSIVTNASYVSGGLVMTTTTGTGDTYYMLTKPVTVGTGIPAGTCFNSTTTIETAIKVLKGGTNWAAQSVTSSEYSYATYTDSESYYRINIGETVDGKTKYGVERGKKYHVTVNKITGPGYPTEAGLITGEKGDGNGPTVKPTDPVETETNVTVSIQTATWTFANQSADL